MIDTFVLQDDLLQQSIPVKKVKIAQDPYGYLSLCIEYEISVEEIAATERNLDELIIKQIVPFLEEHPDLLRVLITKEVYDDQVAVMPIGFEKKDVFDWHNKKLDSETFWTRFIKYWYRDERVDSEEEDAIVRAYLIGVLQKKFVVGIRKDNAWHLPGGIVKTPHFHSIKNHLLEQTGLTLLGLSAGLPILNHSPNQKVILYHGIVNGEPTHGELLPIENLDLFSPIYGNLKAFIEWIQY
jgi:hypothetical protein